MSAAFHSLITAIRACDLCQDELAHGVRPVVQANNLSKILIAGQAPGARVHATGVPFDDPSGDRLRDWMGIDRQTFYDETQIAILPMGFCYPGKGRSGDLPPVPRCAPTWRQKVLDQLPHIQLMLVIGQYAQAWHLEGGARTLTETVKNWQFFGDAIVPLPHPSPRNNIWLKKNPWFELTVLPVLKARVTNALET
ncbi:MAG: uracil-DNA glycosylase family protein [Woeseiaceae bacterium]